MPRVWTEEQRARQADNCRRTRPWEHATGPRTARGKQRSSRNAYKGDPLKRATVAMRAGDYAEATRLCRYALKRRGENGQR